MKKNQSAKTIWLILLLWALLAGCTTSPHKEPGQTTVLSVDGSDISYGVSGQGDVTLVFVHCWTCNHRFWNRQMSHFSHRYRVAWMDLAGHGASRSNRDRYTMQAFGEDVAAVVDQIGAERVVLVGHSMGGPAVVEAAKRLGDKVIGIVGVDTFYTPFQYPKTEAQIKQAVWLFEEDFYGSQERLVRSMFTPQADPETVEWVLGQVAGADREMGVSVMYEMFRWRAAEVPASLERYAGKLRNINAAPMGNEMPGHESVILIPGVGHFIAQVKPDQFNETLEAIVEGFLAN